MVHEILSLSLCLLVLLLSLSACEKDQVNVIDQSTRGAQNPSLVLDDLSLDLKNRLLYGPEGVAPENVSSGGLQARNNDQRVDSLAELFVSQFDSEDNLNSFLLEKGYPAWQTTLLPGEGYGENVFVTPVIGECELKGNLFVFHDNLKPLASHRMDYYSYDYTDMGYMFGANFMSNEELNALYMVAGGQATSQYVMLGTVDTGAVLFRHYVTESGVIEGELSGRTTSCSILLCEGLETSLPPVIVDNGDPNAGGSSGGGGGWPRTIGPGAPGWHNGSYGSNHQPWQGGGYYAGILFTPGVNKHGGRSGGGSGGVRGNGLGGSWKDKVRRFFGQCYVFRSTPDIGNRLDVVSSNAFDLESRSANCRWIQVHGIEDVSMYTYLGNTQLGEDWASDINGFDCRGIAFENEAMGIDFAWGIQNILASYDVDWEMIDCLASNSEYAAAVNFALGHYKDATTCDGTSIEDYLAADMEAFCPGSGNPSAGDELMRRLEGEEWIDYSLYNLTVSEIEAANDLQSKFDICLTAEQIVFLLRSGNVPTFSADIEYFDWLIALIKQTGSQVAFDIMRSIIVAMPSGVATNFLDEKIQNPDSSPYTISMALFFEFALGIGPETRVFEEEHPFTQSLIGSNFTCLALKAWHNGYIEVLDPANPRSDYPSQYRVDFPNISSEFPFVHPNNTGPIREAIADGGYTTSQFTGTGFFKFSFDENEDLITVTLEDSKTLYSLLLHLVDIRQSRSEFKLFGETFQNYTFDLTLAEVENLILACE